MTETELTDRLREAIVLDGPDVWRTNGYLQDAQQAGLSLADALKRANEVSQEVANNSLLFQNIQARIARLAQPSRAHLIEQDLSQIINAATSLKLSPDFVRNRWVPLVLQRLAASSAPKTPEAPAVVTPPTVNTPATKPDIVEELIKSEPERPEPEPQKITIRDPEPVVPPVVPPPVVVEKADPESSFNLYEPPPIVRSFTATPARIHKGQSVTLSWEVENLLAVTIDDLGEGLSPTNRGWVKPAKSTDYTLFDANNNPLSTVRVDVIPRDRSGVYGVLFALALLAIIYWFIKSSNSKSNEPKPKPKTEKATSSLQEERPAGVSTVSHQQPDKEPETTEATDTPTEAPNTPPVASTDVPKKEDKPVNKPVDDTPTAAVSAPKPASPTDARQGKYEEAFGNKPYDKVELGTDDRGWRRARSHGRWGYINEADEWVIQPEYEAVTPFRGNTASVFLNGQLMTINRNGEQVRN
ncbi:WG repeat-containing protein [Spirosoma sp. HMF4905]|uniref:WG repeat-containing protein n=1 Tax=Spirosoma arboris TaxID=2682092 RepID=A0A7K1SBH1_9BACT|nr:WG repeat-containing protein [Spirosoma arboris]MVM31115.1 WG repeat-containing protein [Spirosoma arboris]